MPQKIDNQNDALKFAMKLIGLRRRSEAEIRQRLQDRGCTDELIEATVAELFRFGYLDDAAFAESYIHDRIRFRPAGRFVIAQELKKKNIAPGIIAEKLDALLGREVELELAQKLLEKKLRTADRADQNKLRNRLIFHLQSRGFSSEIISQALRNRVELDENKPLIDQ